MVFTAKPHHARFPDDCDGAFEVLLVGQYRDVDGAHDAVAPTDTRDARVLDLMLRVSVAVSAYTDSTGLASQSRRST